MNVFDLALAFAVGLAAGGVYFAALWLTVRWLADGRLAPAWLLVSAVLRLAFLIGILFWIMDGQADRLLAALAGFLLVRFAAIWPMRGRRTRGATGSGSAPTPEASDATDTR